MALFGNPKFQLKQSTNEAFNISLLGNSKLNSPFITQSNCNVG